MLKALLTAGWNVAFQERLLAQVAAVLSFAVNRARHTQRQLWGFSRTAPNTGLTLGAKQHVFFFCWGAPGLLWWIHVVVAQLPEGRVCWRTMEAHQKSHRISPASLTRRFFVDVFVFCFILFKQGIAQSRGQATGGRANAGLYLRQEGAISASPVRAPASPGMHHDVKSLPGNPQHVHPVLP